MGLFGFPANAGVNPFQYALDRTREAFFGPSAAVPPPGAKAPPRTFGGDMRTAVNDTLAGQYGGGLLAAVNPANSLLAANTLVNGTIHAASGPAGAALYHHGIEATTLPEALQRGVQAIPSAFLDPANTVVDAPRVFFKRRTGPETAQGLARTQNRTELAGQGALMAATAPIGGEAEAPVMAERYGPEMANIFTRVANRLTNGAGIGEEAAHNQALAHIFQGLKQDGATPRQLQQIVAKWQGAGSDAPSLFDALSELPGAGANTKRVILDAIPRNAQAAQTAEQYARTVGTRMKPRALSAVRTLKPQGPSIGDLEAAGDAAQATGTVDADLANRIAAARHARDNVMTTDVTGFMDKMPDFPHPRPVDGTVADPLASQGEGTLHNAMQAGSYEGLYNAVNDGRRPAADLLDDLSPGGHALDTLREFFGDKVDRFAEGIYNEAERARNAAQLNRGFDPFSASRLDGTMATAGTDGAKTLAAGQMPQAVIGAGLRRIIPGTLKTDAELANIAKIATSPAEAVAALPPRLIATQPLPVQAYTLPAEAAHLMSLPRLDGSGGTQGQAVPPPPSQPPAPESLQSSSASWPPFPLQ